MKLNCAENADEDEEDDDMFTDDVDDDIFVVRLSFLVCFAVLICLIYLYSYAALRIGYNAV
jgi:hypothetical protein